ncbi:Fe-S cluster assembly protein DRE2 [Mycena indigotica]|uniref:Fe-S cluster assembly protein DRE2 n=1 Tax=Mycena indigotica TaxID=2126181 RepID=A0A8H6SME0_9AGAR|nr:Fe-S cluster assembly protein DRE2 [Mycena indigotica]KAF7301515.1 Fe-S cluster assembly protein DRE2 [Mycena indigotica]
MSPVALNDAPPPPAKGSALAIGSLATAQDGKYQGLIADLEATRKVDRQMLDRLVDGATTLEASSYSTVHITLSTAEYDSLLPKIQPLLVQLRDGLQPLGALHIHNAPKSESLTSELTLSGFTILSTDNNTALIAQKPAQNIAPTPLALPLKRKKMDAAAKKALWTLTPAPNTPLVDAEALLTDADRARPVPTCEPVKAGVPRRKKACKNCSCGLRELEEAEMRASKVVILDGSVDGEAVEVSQDERQRLVAAAKAAPKATSSCGSCFLGDAFRCASCPYLAPDFVFESSLHPQFWFVAYPVTCYHYRPTYFQSSKPRWQARNVPSAPNLQNTPALAAPLTRAPWVAPKRTKQTRNALESATRPQDVGRKVGDWGSEIARAGGARPKREILKTELETMDIEMELLPVGMERAKHNQSHWDSGTRSAGLTLEFVFPSETPYTLLTHRNPLSTPLLVLLQKHVSGRKTPEWVQTLVCPDADVPENFVPPQCVMRARGTPGYFRFDVSQDLKTLLRHKSFVEYPTIEVWDEFRGTVVDGVGAVTQEAERPAKRRRIDKKAGGLAIAGLLDGYGSSSDDSEQVDEEEKLDGLDMLGGYSGSEDEEDIQLEPAALLELMRQARGDANWTPDMEEQEDEAIDWGDD